MASRRNLKKQIHAASSELINATFFKCFVTEEISQEQLAEIIEQTAVLNNEFLDRANHANGTENPKIIKGYYNQLINDFNARVAEILKIFEA